LYIAFLPVAADAARQGVTIPQLPHVVGLRAERQPPDIGVDAVGAHHLHS